jgi:carboxylesterase
VTPRPHPASSPPPPEAGAADGGPFELPGRAGGRDAVLLLHGLTGSTFELRPIAERLHQAGFRCLAPLMAGHGGAPGALVGLSFNAWVAKAARDLERLAGARRTVVVGCSMGALVACVLAHEHPGRVDGLVLLAPALELSWPGRLAALLGRVGLSRVIVPKVAGSDVRDPEMRRRNPGLSGVPLGAVTELTRLAAQVDRQLPGIAAPTLVLIGGHDHTVTLAGARRLARRLGSGPTSVHVLPESQHLVGIDVEQSRCADEVLAFVEALSVPGQRSAAPRRKPAASTRRRAARRRPKQPTRKPPR